MMTNNNFIPVTILTEYDVPNPDYDLIEGLGDFVTNDEEATIIKKVETKGFIDISTIIRFNECFDIDTNKVVGTWLYVVKEDALMTVLIKEDIMYIASYFNILERVELNTNQSIV